MDGAQRTDRECYSCKDGNFLAVGNELVCENCMYSPDGEEPVMTFEDPWEKFWEHREQYSGFHGPNRVKMVGGFAHAYDD